MLSVLPPMYGRLLAGTRSTTIIHQKLETASTTPATARCHTRRHQPPAAKHRYTTNSAGSSRYACSIFVLKPQPRKNADAASQPSRPDATARWHAHAARTSSRTSSVSGLLSRSIATVIGVRVITSAASRAAHGPNTRRTVACSTPTAATPISTDGSSRLHVPKPKRRAKISCTHSAIGGLSTVMYEAESSEPKKNAFQLDAPLRTAAA